MEIRRAIGEEWEQLRGIRLAALADTPTAFSSTYEVEASWPDENWRAWARASGEGTRQATLIAVASEGWIGIATGAIHRSRPGAILYSMWVAPVARRRGIGRGLVHAVIEWARARDLPAVWLWVNDANTAALRMYTAAGFEPTGRREGAAHELTLRLIEQPPIPDDSPSSDFHLGVLAILPPDPLTTLVGSLRERFDPISAALAPPHITVTQPLAVPLTEARSRRLADILASISAFEIAYGPARTFPGTVVEFLAIEPETLIRGTRGRLHLTGWFRLDLPHTDDFVPHLTVREFAGANATRSNEVRRIIDGAVPPGRFVCRSMVLLSPGPDRRFAPTASFTLDAAAADGTTATMVFYEERPRRQ